MKKKLLLISFLVTVFFSLSATADTTPDLTIIGLVDDAIKAEAASKLMPMAMAWVGGFLFLQFFMTQLKLLMSGGDIAAVLGKLIGNVFWAGFCVYVVSNGPDFINSVGQGILSNFGSGVGVGAILASTTTLTVAVVSGMAIVSPLNSAVAQLLLVIAISIFFSGVYLAIKIFMLQLELGLIVMLAPLSFSFLGMDALRDQGIAPLKSLISLGYRIILIGIISGAFMKVFDVAKTDISNLNWLTAVASVKVLIGTITAFPILVFLLFKSDAIAASLAGGHTSMGASDVGGAAMAGAAMGSAASGVASTVKSGLPPGMLGNMMGGGAGSVSNGGFGGRPPEPRIDPPPPRPPSSSLHSAEAFAEAKAEWNSRGSSATGRPAGAGVNPDPSARPRGPETQSYPKQNQNTGNAADAGIGGSNSGSGSASGSDTAGGDKLQKTLDGLLNQMSAPKQDSFGQRLKDLNQHVAQEKAATHVSINPRAGD
jgi:type IV secretion system protein TrbL